MESLQELLRRAWARFCVFLGYPPPGADGGQPPAVPERSDWPPAPALYTELEQEAAASEPTARKPQPLSEILAQEVEPDLVAEFGELPTQEPLPFEADLGSPSTPAPPETVPELDLFDTAREVPPLFELEAPPAAEPDAGAAPAPAWEPVEREEEPQPASTLPQVRPYRYEVRAGETLSSIAKRFGVTLRHLVETNDLPDPNRIYAGQKLTIPGYVPVDFEEEEAEPLAQAVPDLGEAFRYAVEPDDTLSSIAMRFGITVPDLIEANDLDDDSALPVGHWLVIPGRRIEPLELEAEPEPGPPEAEVTPPPVIAPALVPPEQVRGIYLSHDAAGQAAFREYVGGLLAGTALNTLVIDVKDEFGRLTHASQVPLAVEIAASQASAPDLAGLVADLTAAGVYPIARLVAFKDNPLAEARPEWALKTLGSEDLWRDRAGQGWVDPFLEEVWEYNLQLAEEAARLGFAEILFDFLRFPTHGPLGRPQFSQEATQATRVAALTSFLGTARSRLKPFGVDLSANVFGYACWRKDDTLVGHSLERLSAYLDAICPTLFPSTFGSGIPGCQVAVECPYEVVHQSARRAVERVADNNCLVRPWLQDFPDYRFDRRTFSRQEIQAQISGALEAGCAGFLVWDPRVKYTPEAYTDG